jgi:dihydroneopterin aldolase
MLAKRGDGPRGGAGEMAERRRKDRAQKGASGAAPTPDRIFMRDLVLDVEIGVYTNEKGVTQRVRFDVEVDLAPAGALDDDIARAFDYDNIIDGIKSIVASGHVSLVETLAERIAAHCLDHPRAASVRVRVEKLDKEPGAVGVEIVRAKGT